MKYGISGSSGSTGAIGSMPNSANIFSTSSEGVLDQGLIGDSGIPGTLTGTVLGECLRISFQSFIRANSTNWIPVVCTQPNNIFFLTLCAILTDREMTLMGRSASFSIACTSMSE